MTFVSLAAYPTLVDSGSEQAGGAEFQQITLARWLRERGHEVSLVVGDYGQARVMEAEGLILHRAFAPGVGNRKLRFIPDMLELRRAIRRADAELVNQRSTVFYTAQCCAFAHEAGAAFVFSIGSDYNCEADLRGRAPRPIRNMYRWGIQRADAVLAQTRRQQEMMEQNFGVSSRLGPNLLSIPAIRRESDEEAYVLWIGSLSRLKRPDLYLNLAKALPEVRFLLAGGPGEDPGFDQEVRARAATIPNLEWLGFVPPARTHDLYRRASLLVGTSEFEGMPNTYLQAWSHGVPVISVSVDPDGLISRLGLGEVVGSPQRLPEAVHGWLSDAKRSRRAGELAHEYVKGHHDIDKIAERIEGMFQEAIDRRG